MGVWDVINDLVEAATPWSTAEAEAPVHEKATTESPEEVSEESKSDDAATEVTETKEEETQEEEAEEAEEAEEEAEEEEEEEEELVDPKEKLEEECKNSKECAPAKHHFDECVERVTNASNDGGEKEDCVEEFFHLAHCASQCAAPKLWSVLK